MLNVLPFRQWRSLRRPSILCLRLSISTPAIRCYWLDLQASYLFELGHLDTCLVILTELNDHTNARKAYKKALQLDSDDFIVRLNYAVFEYHHGELSESQQLLQNMKTPKNIDHAQFAVSIFN